MHGRWAPWFVALVGVASCAARPDGYSPSHPTELTCGCEGGDACYEGASQLASTRGENAETGEKLLYFAQCACFQGSVGGCNTLSHFAKDFVAACDGADDTANSCTIAGFVHLHGVRVPHLNGRSFDPDANAAALAFQKACTAGSVVACRQHATK